MCAQVEIDPTDQFHSFTETGVLTAAGQLVCLHVSPTFMRSWSRQWILMKIEDHEQEVQGKPKPWRSPINPVMMPEFSYAGSQGDQG